MPNRELSHPLQSLPWATNASLTSGTTGHSQLACWSGVEKPKPGSDGATTRAPWGSAPPPRAA
jgi:hypothetical protein